MRKRKHANNRQIMSFSLVWAEMYKHHNTIPSAFFEDQMFVGDGMAALGFEMDCGKSLRKKFPDIGLSTENLGAWKEVLAKIDLETLGNALFSRWRYFNHWDHPSGEADYEWFVMGFTRMAELAELAEKR